MGGSYNGSQNYKQYSQFDYRASIHYATENVYNPFYEDSKVEEEEFYLDMNENLMKEYENFLFNAKQNNSKVHKQQQNLGGNRGQSPLLDWSQLIQKQLNQEKSTMSMNDNRNKLQKAYRALIVQDERHWYEEMITLYKVCI